MNTAKFVCEEACCFRLPLYVNTAPHPEHMCFFSGCASLCVLKEEFLPYVFEYSLHWNIVAEVKKKKNA